MTKSLGICILLGLISLVSVFGCAPLQTNKVPLGSTVLKSLGIVGYWNFDETTLGTAPGGADFADSSGQGHHAVAGGNLTLGVIGVENTGVRSMGSGYVVVPIDLSSMPVVSISLWFYPHISGTNTANVLYEYTQDSSASGANGFLAALDVNNGSLSHAFAFWLHGSNGFFGKQTPTSSTAWHNVLATFDHSNASQNTITVAIDGQTVNLSNYPGYTASSGGNFAACDLFLLCRGGSSLCSSADIDELVIWNRVVSVSDLDQLYHF